MPPPRFGHGYANDVFLSYTHIDDAPFANRRWVTQFADDLRAQLTIVSGHSVVIWRDEEKLGAADRFDDTIAQAIAQSAILLVVLSPGYFASEYCERERETFYDHVRKEGRETVGTKARVVKAAKFRVPPQKYPADLLQLLEYKFYEEIAGSDRVREFHVSNAPEVRDRYWPKIDDMAQEIDLLLRGLEEPATAEVTRGRVYLAEVTSDLEPVRDNLRRRLIQLGFDVQPRQELRLLPPGEIQQFVSESIRGCRLAIHPLGAFYGFVPEGGDGKSVVQMQLELSLADRRNGGLPRIIWVPESLIPKEEIQRQFLERVRTQFAGHGFELLEQPFDALATRVEERLRPRPEPLRSRNRPGVYLVCDEVDRVLAKTLRTFLFSQHHRVEWPPYGLKALSGNEEHLKLLQRNGAHLVVHGATTDGWIQDRIHELDENATLNPTGSRRQAIYLADPRRPDKDEILARDTMLLPGYGPVTVGDALEPFLSRLVAEHGEGGRSANAETPS